MDDLNLSSTVGQTSWQHNLFCTVLYTLLLSISFYFLAKLYYYLISEGIKAWKEAFQAMKDFYAILRLNSEKTSNSEMNQMILFEGGSWVNRTWKERWWPQILRQMTSLRNNYDFCSTRNGLIFITINDNMGLILLQISMQVRYEVIWGHPGSLTPSSGEIKNWKFSNLAVLLSFLHAL